MQIECVLLNDFGRNDRVEALSHLLPSLRQHKRSDGITRQETDRKFVVAEKIKAIAGPDLVFIVGPVYRPEGYEHKHIWLHAVDWPPCNAGTEHIDRNEYDVKKEDLAYKVVGGGMLRLFNHWRDHWDAEVSGQSGGYGIFPPKLLDVREEVAKQLGAFSTKFVFEKTVFPSHLR